MSFGALPSALYIYHPSWKISFFTSSLGQRMDRSSSQLFVKLTEKFVMVFPLVLLVLRKIFKQPHTWVYIHIPPWFYTHTPYLSHGEKDKDACPLWSHPTQIHNILTDVPIDEKIFLSKKERSFYSKFPISRLATVSVLLHKSIFLTDNKIYIPILPSNPTTINLTILLTI